jgi:hypothetical protein|tara:strand:- start:119 stop:304 length:186 start_codon:yes stop_codon:yes gene_type:complete
MRFNLVIETKENMEPNQFINFVLRNLRQTRVEIANTEKLGASHIDLKDDFGNVIGDFEFKW